MTQCSVGRFFAAVIFMCSLAQTPCYAQTDLSDHPVYLAFADYKSAILQADAEKALQVVDASTLQYYSDMLDHALNAVEDTVRELSTMDLLMVLSIRHRLEAEQIKSMDASNLFKHGVANGWTGKESVMGIEVVRINVDGQTATAAFTANGVESPIPFRFDNEGGQWKVDLTAIMDASNSAFRQMAQQQGITEVELVFMLLEMVTGKEVDSKRLWKPVNHW